jgi:class 3 adenylate cyclase
LALPTSIVRYHDGAVVKIIGDAVMASFGDPPNAVKAALAMQARVADLELKAWERQAERGHEPQDRLDYFAST